MKILILIAIFLSPVCNGGCDGYPSKCSCKDGVVCSGASCSMCRCEVCNCSSLDKFKAVR